MKSNEIRQLKPASWVGPIMLLAAAGAVGLWLWRTQDSYVPLGLTVGLLVLTVTLNLVWLYHVYATRRQFAVWNAYAEQELARAEHRLSTPSIQNERHGSRSLV